MPCGPNSCLFWYFVFFGRCFNCSVCNMKFRLQNVISQYHFAYWNVHTPELLEGGHIFLRCWKTGIFKYELHLKGILLYVCSCVRCIKNWIVVCYRGNIYPQKTAFLLLLESDAAGTSLSGHLSRVLFLMWRCKCTGDREQHLWSYWSPEGCIKKWHEKAKGCGCL